MKVLAGVLVLLVLAVLAGALGVRSYMHSPLPEAAAGFVFTVAEGATLNVVADELAAAGVLSRPRVFAQWGRATGAAQRIKAGEYELSGQVTPAEVLALLVKGRVKLHSFTLVEGWTLRELEAAIAASPVLQQTLSFASPEQLAEELALPVTHAEGMFLPDTYRVPQGQTDRELLQQAAALMQEALAAAWAERADDLPLQSAYELLTLASIVERETGLAAERDRVAGVFVRRLRIGMRLQTDPTVIYGLGAAFDGDLRRRDLTTDTPYNTYTRAGLPPTPIAMPGVAALRAAANPAESDALYFVATGRPDGSHQFSATLEQHNAAVAAYLARLRQTRNEAAQ